MKTKLRWLAISCVFALGACEESNDNDTRGDGEEESSGGETGNDTTGPAPTTTPPSTTITTAGETSGGNGEYDFAPGGPGDFDQVDRMGMPAINTAVIASKDDYNAADPSDDLANAFTQEIVDSVTFLHTALDDDLMGAGLIPCEAADCVGQAAPLVIPDTLKIDLSAGAGFPNGRLPADPVVDVTLAVVLLDLGAAEQDATTLAGLPLNPPENDVDFPEAFPFFAEPH